MEDEYDDLETDKRIRTRNNDNNIVRRETERETQLRR